MSSDPSRPDSPIPDLDLEVGDWSGSEKDLASRPIETVVTTRGAGDSERGAFADTEHDVKDEAAENVNMGRTANQHHHRDSVIILNGNQSIRIVVLSYENLSVLATGPYT